MSAYVVSRAHIDVLVHTAVDGPKWPEDRTYGPGYVWPTLYWSGTQSSRSTVDTVGAMLVSECVASVSYRYPQDTIDTLPGPVARYYVTGYEYRRPRRTLTAAEALKALDCYEYQSCEHPGWEASEARAFCDALRSALISFLPGYDAAPWEWSDELIAS